MKTKSHQSLPGKTAKYTGAQINEFTGETAANQVCRSSFRRSLLHVASVYSFYSPYAFDRRVQGLFGGPCLLYEIREDCNLCRWV